MKSKTGFTLVELVIVILVIGIIAAVTIPKMISQGGVATSLAADMAAADIRAVRHAAISSGTAKTITFNGAWYTAQGLYPPGRALPGDAVASAFSVTFNSLGEPNQGGSFTVGAGAASSTITVEEVTGKVTAN